MVRKTKTHRADSFNLLSRKSIVGNKGGGAGGSSSDSAFRKAAALDHRFFNRSAPCVPNEQKQGDTFEGDVKQVIKIGCQIVANDRH